MLPGWPWGHQMTRQLSLDVKTVRGTQSAGTLRSEETGLNVDGTWSSTSAASFVFCVACHPLCSRSPNIMICIF